MYNNILLYMHVRYTIYVYGIVIRRWGKYTMYICISVYNKIKVAR